MQSVVDFVEITLRKEPIEHAMSNRRIDIDISKSVDGNYSREAVYNRLVVLA